MNVPHFRAKLLQQHRLRAFFRGYFFRSNYPVLARFQLVEAVVNIGQIYAIYIYYASLRTYIQYRYNYYHLFRAKWSKKKKKWTKSGSSTSRHWLSALRKKIFLPSSVEPADDTKIVSPAADIEHVGIRKFFLNSQKNLIKFLINCKFSKSNKKKKNKHKERSRSRIYFVGDSLTCSRILRTIYESIEELLRTGIIYLWIFFVLRGRAVRNIFLSSTKIINRGITQFWPLITRKKVANLYIFVTIIYIYCMCTYCSPTQSYQFKFG